MFNISIGVRMLTITKVETSISAFKKLDNLIESMSGTQIINAEIIYSLLLIKENAKIVNSSVAAKQ